LGQLDSIPEFWSGGVSSGGTASHWVGEGEVVVILLVASCYRKTFSPHDFCHSFPLQGVDGDELPTSLNRLFYDINLNRSNSDCTTRKTEGSPFVRMSVERTSMRRKKVSVT